MLKKIRLQTFKSFVDAEVELAPLTLLVGANASGKSNLLDALRFLKGVAMDFTLREALNGAVRGGITVWPGIRGGVREAARHGSADFALKTTWALPKKPQEQDGTFIDSEYEHAITCGTNGTVTMLDEWLIPVPAGFDRLFWTVTPGSPLEVVIEGIPAAPVRLSGERSVLAELPLAMPSYGGFPSQRVLAVSGSLIEMIGGMWFFDPIPSAMRGYGNENAPLDPDGQNLSGALARMCSKADDRLALVDWLAEICAPELADIDFIRVPETSDTLFVLVEKDGTRTTARSLSDGTLRFLALVVALRSAKPGSIYLIEEIESYLHPRRIKVLVDLLEQVSTSGVQVIATTHSPVALQWLDDQTLRDAVVCARLPDREGTFLRRLGDIPHLDDATKKLGIDEIFTTGWLEMAL